MVTADEKPRSHLPGSLFGTQSALVPTPERYAVHKLIVAERRRSDAQGLTKSDKDLRQAGSLIQAMVGKNRSVDLTDAYAEAWGRGPAWRAAITASVDGLDVAARAALRTGLRTGLKSLGLRAEDLGLLEAE